MIDISEWIDVNERLPEDGKYVLLYTPKDDKIRIGWHVRTAWEGCLKWMFVTAMRSRLMNTLEPSHWCELPLKPGRE